MRINVIAKTNANAALVKQIDENTFEVSIPAVPEKGKANAAIICALKKHFKVAKSNIAIKSGLKNKRKVIEINEAK